MVLRWLLAALLVSVASTSKADENGPDAGSQTISQGVYSAEQAARGEFVYPSICGRCHGYRLDGAPDDPDFFPTPPIAGPKFIRKWAGVSLAVLFEYTRAEMPSMNPGSLSDQEFVDVIAYMLAAGGAPAGPDELPVDPAVLATIIIE